LKLNPPLLSSKPEALEQHLEKDLESTETEDLGPEIEVREILVPETLHLQRLDVVLTALLPEFSRNFVQQLISESCVEKIGVVERPPSGSEGTQAQIVTKIASKAHAFERFRLSLKPSPQALAYKPQQMEIDVLYEDTHLRVINKPANLVVHPAPGNWGGTLLNGLLFMDPNLTQVPRAGIVHRLDKDTSGLMVVAKTRACMDALVVQIANRDVHREYLAIAHRAWSGPEVKVVEASIGRDPKNRLKMAVVDLLRTPGKAAKTTFTALGNGVESDPATAVTLDEEVCLVHCELHTGRTHQIRVHLSSIGHPILADLVYGGRLHKSIKRQALHAYKLGFDHPITGQPMSFKAELPADMKAALEAWSLGYNIPS
jgi:23S rRNA pseudouridine1911/1915/1917 synthase